MQHFIAGDKHVKDMKSSATLTLLAPCPRSSAISSGGFGWDHAHWIELSAKFRGVRSRYCGVVFCLVFLCLQRMQRVFTKRVSFLELNTLNCTLSFLNHWFWALFSPVSRSARPVDRDRKPVSLSFHLNFDRGNYFKVVRFVNFLSFPCYSSFLVKYHCSHRIFHDGKSSFSFKTLINLYQILTLWAYI